MSEKLTRRQLQILLDRRRGASWKLTKALVDEVLENRKEEKEAPAPPAPPAPLAPPMPEPAPLQNEEPTSPTRPKKAWGKIFSNDKED